MTRRIRTIVITAAIAVAAVAGIGAAGGASAATHHADSAPNVLYHL